MVYKHQKELSEETGIDSTIPETKIKNTSMMLLQLSIQNERRILLPDKT